MPRGQALGITFQLPEQDKGELAARRAKWTAVLTYQIPTHAANSPP